MGLPTTTTVTAPSAVRWKPRPDLRPSSPASTIRSSSGGGAYSGSLNSSYIDLATAIVVSSPMRSASASGPIGWAQPCTMPVSMSSAVAKPDSSIRIADSRYGISSAFTMNPARSCERITCLPSVSVANGPARSVVVGLGQQRGHELDQRAAPAPG